MNTNYEHDYFYDPQNVTDFATILGTEIKDTFKYLISNKVLDANEPDFDFLTPELLEAFEDLKFDCQEFISAYNYYSIYLELFEKAEAEGKVEEVRSDHMKFTKQVIAEMKKRGL